MNTIGKILVVLNFLFAIAVGVLLVIYVVQRTPWKEAYANLKREADAMKLAREATLKVTDAIANENRAKDKVNDELKQKIKDKEVEMQVLEDSYKIQIEERNNKLRDGDFSLREALKTKERLVEEIALLNKGIQDREAKIVALAADVKLYRIQAVSNESNYNTAKQQNENLLLQIRDLEQQKARVAAGANAGQGIKILSGFNPPAVKVKGKIVNVDAVQKDLVEISLGTDQGVNKDNTLDVYRFNPEPKYLGTIRIIEAYHHKSVGRLQQTGPAALRPQLKQGDEVASSITPR